jgi:hypothetical protein
MGPSNYIVTEASKAQSLADLFLALVFVKVARLTDKYCYKDFVVERTAKDSHGNVKKIRCSLTVMLQLQRPDIAPKTKRRSTG